MKENTLMQWTCSSVNQLLTVTLLRKKQCVHKWEKGTFRLWVSLTQTVMREWDASHFLNFRVESLPTVTWVITYAVTDRWETQWWWVFTRQCFVTTKVNWTDNSFMKIAYLLYNWSDTLTESLYCYISRVYCTYNIWSYIHIEDVLKGTLNDPAVCMQITAMTCNPVITTLVMLNSTTHYIA